MASVSDIKECINNLLPEYSVDVKEDFDNAAISFHIKKGVNSYVLKVSDGFIEGKTLRISQQLLKVIILLPA